MIKRWFNERVLFLAWHRHWKGVYVHFLPKYCYRVYLDKGRIVTDRHRKPNREMMER